jgi:hypothetical protein
MNVARFLPAKEAGHSLIYMPDDPVALVDYAIRQREVVVHETFTFC